MKIYLDCSMGASGDMFMAALYELLTDKSAFRERMEQLGLPGVTLEFSDSVKCGIKGTHISVKVGGAEEISEDDPSYGQNNNHKYSHSHEHEHIHLHHHHHHAGSGSGGRRFSFNEILDMIRELDLPQNVIDNALCVFSIIGEAEASVHGAPLDSVHLHEIGSLDAVADIVGCCLLISMLGVTEISASPVNVGSGSVRCEHGILPVPAPAAAEILKGIPIYGGKIKGELCTPTGAALLKHFVTSFGGMMPVIVTKIGYGMGLKDFEIANCLRAFLCEDSISDGGERDRVCEISCNLDDMTPEAIGAVFDLMFDNGALDVYTTPIFMKKNRPAVALTCICAENMRDKLTRLMLEHTSTLGVRMAAYHRELLSRAVKTVKTEYGNIRVKHAEGFGIVKYKPEYDDVLAAAYRHGVPFVAVFDAAMRAAR